MARLVDQELDLDALRRTYAGRGTKPHRPELLLKLLIYEHSQGRPQPVQYFGLHKGIVSYTLVANHIPVNATIIGANEHESHYVFDLLFNNSTEIQPDVHSTDTHGANIAVHTPNEPPVPQGCTCAYRIPGWRDSRWCLGLIAKPSRGPRLSHSPLLTEYGLKTRQTRLQVRSSRAAGLRHPET